MKVGANLYIPLGAIKEGLVVGGVGKINQRGPLDIGTSKLNPDSHSAKISNILITVYSLLSMQTKICAVSTVPFMDGIYVEFTENTDVGDKLIACTMDDTEINWLSNSPEKQIDCFIPFVVYALNSDDVVWQEFKQAYSKLASKYNHSKNFDYIDCLLLCDSFYYACKQKWTKHSAKAQIEVTERNDLTVESITQMGRAIHTPCFVNTMVTSPKDFELIKFAKKDEDKKEKAPESKVSTIETGCKNGSYILPFEWDEERRKKIPSLSFLDTFIFSKEFGKALNLINYDTKKVINKMDMGYETKDAIGNNYLNMIFTGKPGTGKTTVATALAASLGLPIYTCPTTKNGEEDEYQGKTKVAEEGGFKFCMTPFLEGYTHGGIIVLEEFNLASPDLMMGILGQAIEKPFVLFQDGYKPVTRHPLCIIIMTCNMTTQGTKEQNEAFTSRGPNVYILDDPSDEDFLNILRSNSEDVTESDIKKVFNFFKQELRFIGEKGDEDILTSVTLRHCLAALKQIASGSTVKEAITDSLVNTVALKSKEMRDMIYEGLVEPMR